MLLVFHMFSLNMVINTYTCTTDFFFWGRGLYVLYSLLRLFHSIWAEPILRCGENGWSLRKNTRKQNLACLTCYPSWAWTHSYEMTSDLECWRLMTLTTKPQGPPSLLLTGGMAIVCVCVFGFNVAFNNFSVISRRCLVATGSLMLTFIVLPHWSIMSQTLEMIPHPVTLSWHCVDQS